MHDSEGRQVVAAFGAIHEQLARGEVGLGRSGPLATAASGFTSVRELIAGKLMRIVLATVVSLLSLLATIPARAQPATNVDPPGLRVLNLNVGSIYPTDTGTGWATTDLERAERIAYRIWSTVMPDNKPLYDVLILQEVFKQDVKIKLVFMLLPGFQHIVGKVGSASLVQDSGLMIFSRYRFETIANLVPSIPFVPPSVNACVEPESLSWMFNQPGSEDDVVAFVDLANYIEDVMEPPFIGDLLSCASAPETGYAFGDCHADKGVVHVQVINPTDQQRYYIFGTHLQSNYADANNDAPGEGPADDWREYNTIRKNQLTVLRRMIRDCVPEETGGGANIIVGGDFNINGYLKYPALTGTGLGGGTFYDNPSGIEDEKVEVDVSEQGRNNNRAEWNFALARIPINPTICSRLTSGMHGPTT